MIRSIEETVINIGLGVMVILAFLAASTLFQQKNNQLINNIDFNDSLSNQMRTIFMNSETETVFCLFGKIENDTLSITEIRLAEEMNSSTNQVYSNCPSNTLATVHNHDDGICKLSSNDIYTFGKSGLSIIGVYCGGYNYAFYNQASLDLSTVKQFNHRTGSTLNI